MVRTTGRLSAAFLVLLSSFAIAACGGDDDEGGGGGGGGGGGPIKVGSHLPLTGAASFVGQGFRAGTDMAVEQINAAGGVNGRNIEMVYVDTEATPTGGINAVRNLAENENVAAIHSGGTSGETVPALPLIERTGIPYVALGADPAIYDPIKPNIFTGSTTPEPIKAQSAADWIVEHLDPQTVAMSVCDAGHCVEGAPVLQSALEEQGVEVIAQNDHGIADTDFSAQAQELIRAQPDLIYIYSLAASGGRFLDQLRTRGWEGPVAGDSGQATPDIPELAGEGAEGFYTTWFAATQVPSDETGAMGEFMDGFDAAYPNPPAGLPNIYSMMGYQDIYVLAEAMRRAGDDVNSETINAALEGMEDFVAGEDDVWTDAYAIGTPRTYGPDDHVGSEYAAMVTVENGEFVFAEGEE